MADEKKTDDYQIDMGDRRPSYQEPEKPFQPPQLQSNWKNHPMLPILSYCASSISMTVANKYVLRGQFNLNFFFLCLQVCCPFSLGLVATRLTGDHLERRVCVCCALRQNTGVHHIPQLQD